jgi:SNF2 family DNA or RNA helicase
MTHAVLRLLHCSQYFTMIEFVSPRYLGTPTDFNARFATPIAAGQCLDSTPLEVATMQKRAHVLHKKLERIVHRVDYSMLRSGKAVHGIQMKSADNSDALPATAANPTAIHDVTSLPTKHEYVVFVRLTDFQRKLYQRFIQTHQMSMLKAYHALAKICQCSTNSKVRLRLPALPCS